jgi:hypothetical protein
MSPARPGNLLWLKRLRVLDLTGNDGYTDEALASLMRALPDLQVVKLRPRYRPPPIE